MLEKENRGIPDEDKNHNDAGSLKSRLKKYRHEMENLRAERDQSLLNDRELKLAVLEAWKNLKEIQIDQGSNLHYKYD